MNAAFTVVKGTTLEAGTAGRWEFAENAQDSLQAYVLTAGFSSRLGEWLLGAHYQGRVPASHGLFKRGVVQHVQHRQRFPSMGPEQVGGDPWGHPGTGHI